MAKTTANKKKNASAARKLVPAVGMLAVSAAMLSTATYAWFTMSKNAQVTGLQMAATTTNDLEISLGQVGTNKTSLSASRSSPAMSDLSWRNSILFSDYYLKFGKLLPASSNCATSIWYVENSKVYSAGKNVQSTASVYLAGGESDSNGIGYTNGDTGGEVKYAFQESAFSTSPTDISVDNDEDAKGYYIDIPMWIRSSRLTGENETTSVYCSVVINDSSLVEDEASTDDLNLEKAVRVAIIPIADGSTSSDAVGAYTNSDGTLTNASTANSSTAVTFFGLDGTTYSGSGEATSRSGDKVLKQASIYSSGNADTTGYAVSLGDAPTVKTSATLTEAPTDSTLTTSNSVEVFKLPANTVQGNYGVVSFVARIWIEGESPYCWDATADQDWNIDFYFSTEQASGT